MMEQPLIRVNINTVLVTGLFVASLVPIAAENGTGLDRKRLLTDLLEFQMDHCSAISLCTIKTRNNESAISSYNFCCNNCSCENDCMQLGTCCPDFRLAGLMGDNTFSSISDLSDRLSDFNSTIIQKLLETETLLRVKQGDLACLEAKAVTNVNNADLKRLPNSYWMINTCPQDIQDNINTVRKCSDDVPFDPFFNSINNLSIPVTSTKTNKTYKNIYCFQCNEDGYVTSDLSIWRVILFCVNSEIIFDLYDNPYELFKRIRSTNAFLHCNLLYIPKSDIQSLVSRCDIVDIYTCPEESDKLLQNVCGAFHLPVIFTGGKYFTRYRNIACFQCNKKEKHQSECVDWHPDEQDYSMDLNFPVDEHNTILRYDESDLHVLNVTVIKDDGGRCKTGFILNKELGTCRRVLCPRRFYPLNGSCIPVFTYLEKVYFTVMLEVRRLQKLDRGDEAIFHQILSKSVDRIADGLFKQFTYGLWKMASDYDILVVSFTTWPNQTTYVDMLTLFLHFLKQIATLKVLIKSLTVEPIIMIAKDTTSIFFGGQLHKRRQTLTPLPAVRDYLGLGKSLNEMSISSANFCYRVKTGPTEVEYVKINNFEYNYIQSNTGVMINSQDVTASANRVIMCIDDIYNNLTDVNASYMFAEVIASGYKQFSQLRQIFNPQDSDLTSVNDVNGTVNASASCAPSILFTKTIHLCTLVVALISA